MLINNKLKKIGVSKDVYRNKNFIKNEVHQVNEEKASLETLTN